MKQPLVAAPFLWIVSALLLMFGLTTPVFSEEPLSPTGDDDAFFSMASLYCAEGFATDNFGAANVYFGKFKLVWGPSQYLAYTEFEALPAATGGTDVVPIVTFYPTSFYASFPEISGMLKSLATGAKSDEEVWGFFCALLSLTMQHEMLHHCYGLDEDSMIEFSCQHASIAYAVHTSGCSTASNLAALIADAEEDLEGETDPEELAELEEALKRWRSELQGICLGLDLIEHRWNGSDQNPADPDAGHAEKVRACIDGKGSLPTPLDGTDYPPANCDGGYPQLPNPPATTDSGFPDDIVFPPCSACDGIVEGMDK